MREKSKCFRISCIITPWMLVLFMGLAWLSQDSLVNELGTIKLKKRFHFDILFESANKTL